MVEIVPFGKYKNNSVEQIVLKDYKYFNYIITNLQKEEFVIHKDSLRKRFLDIDHYVNHFVSKINCVNCNELPAEKISIYEGYQGFRGSDLGHIYCSSQCYNIDPSISEKSMLYPLAFNSALSKTKSDTNHLVEIISNSMGLKGKRKSKKYLKDFFDNIQLKENNQLSFFNN